MYNEFFGFHESPFSIAPDPRYLFMSEQHREALAHLLYGFNSEGGFVLLTGEVGTGKTTVCRCLLEQIPENSAIAFILNPKLTVEELLATICDEFGIRYSKIDTSIKVFIDMINNYLLDVHEKGRKAVLIIDEAQNLGADVLEQLRLLTNLETNRHKLLHIILIGQPELKDKLSRTELRQLSQRIIARYHLQPLSNKDISAYVTHRLNVAGAQKQFFPDSSIEKLYQLTHGIPRLINAVCDRALLGAFVLENQKVSKSILKKAAYEVLGETINNRKRPFRKTVWALSALALIVFGAVVAWTYHKSNLADEKMEVNKDLSGISAKVDMEESLRFDNMDWPEHISVDKSKDLSYQALFKKWNMDYKYEEHGPACDFAESKGLKCLYEQGNLRSILLFNRPAILKLFDNDNRSFYAALIFLDKQRATLIIGPETRNVSLNDIESRWLGDYTILWRPPEGFSKSIYYGYEGPLVDWLSRQLAQIQDRPLNDRASTIYSKELEAEVIKFQTSVGLIPDGIAGVKTIIHINSLTDNEIPKLSTEEVS